jgi:aryl-alcohol dehydrogenase-like predicted oxidoreductase
VSVLPTATLGRTGLVVSRLGFGSLNLGGKGTRLGRVVPPAVADQVLNAVLDAGITLIDTAPDYGEAEDVIGRHIAHRRDEYILASKCGCPVGALADAPPPPDRPKDHVHTPENIRAGVEQSLRRLRTDRIDLVQVHNSPSRRELEANHSIGELDRLRSEGKVRFIGMSAVLPDVVDHLAMGVFDVIQVPYSALQPEHEGVIDAAARQGLGVVVRGGIAQGSLSGTPDAAPTYRQSQARDQHDRWAAAALEDLLDGMTETEFVLRFTLSRPAIGSTIVGTSDVGHLAANVATATKGPLPPDVYAEARRRLRLP